MFRLVATAVLGYVAYRIAREMSDAVPSDFGSHLPQQHRRPRPKTSAKPAVKRARRSTPKTDPASSSQTA